MLDPESKQRLIEETGAERLRTKTAPAGADPERPAGGPTETPLAAAEYKRTLLLLAKMMVMIFLCEAAIMVFLAVVPLSRRWSILADPVLLTVIGAPLMYWLLVRPIRRALEDRKKAEQKLLVYQRQLKSLASQLSLTEEHERRRLATELHDRIGQNLILCKIKLDQLLGHSPSGEYAESVQEICDDLREIIQRSRNLISDLSSPILYDLGIEAALEEWLTEEVQRKHGIETEFEDDGLPKPLDEDTQTILFRNARELLTNVVEHAGARRVKVSISRTGTDVVVRVEDDGIGFDPGEIQASSASRAEFGLLGIRERMERIGGSLEVASHVGGGTRISMVAPLREMAPEKSTPEIT